MNTLVKKFFDALIPRRDNLSWKDVEPVLKEEVEDYKFPPNYNDDLAAYQRVEKARKEARIREYEKNQRFNHSIYLDQ